MADYLKISNSVRETIKNTVGYAEAVNKESFMVGASVAFLIAEDYYSSEMKELKMSSNLNESVREDLEKDLKTLAEIISKYQDRS